MTSSAVGSVVVTGRQLLCQHENVEFELYLCFLAHWRSAKLRHSRCMFRQIVSWISGSIFNEFIDKDIFLPGPHCELHLDAIFPNDWLRKYGSNSGFFGNVFSG